MPGEMNPTIGCKTIAPNLKTSKQSDRPFHRSNRLSKRDMPQFIRLNKLILASSVFLSGSLIPKVGFAQTALQSLFSNGTLNSSSAGLFALFGGSVGFAMFATFWLIRERNKVYGENAALRKQYALNKADKERFEALINTSDQCTLIWDPETKKAETIGSLNQNSDQPIDASIIPAFGKWLSTNSTMEIEPAISKLQEHGIAFDMIVETLNGSFVEAQGRTSGSFSFVRFKELDEKRRNLASLAIEHDRLLDKFNLVETLFQRLPFPLWIRNADGNLHWVNNAYSDAVEAEDNEVATKENRLLFDQNERNKIIASQKENPFFESDLPAIVSGDRKTLQTFDIQTNTGSVGMAVDRSDLDDARNQLKETNTSHAQTIDNLATAIAIFDANKNLSFANSSFQSLWELDQMFLDEQPSNDQVFEAMKASGKLSEMPDWKKWKGEQLEIYQSTENKNEEWHLPDGQTLRVIANPQSQGGVSWAFENVTEQLELKSSYNALMRVQGETLDHLTEAVAVFGSDGKIRLTNPTFLNVWKFEEPFALDGKHINAFSEKCVSLLLNKDEWENIRLGITGVTDSRDDLSGQIELLNGSIYHYHLVQLPDAQSMLTLVDMTASTNVERALKERNDALEESDALKTRFIQHVSYELRAPLTSIAGFAEILTDDATGKLNEKQSEYLDYISQSSDVLKALIDDILDLATIDAGVMQLNLETVSIDEIIGEAVEGIEEQLNRQQLKIKVNGTKKAPNLIADAERLKQILHNLISNAANASPDGGEIKIDTASVEDGINITIADQGSGIPDNMKDLIFERFESGKSREARKGAGLGLSIVKSFVELHGGTVHVEDAGKRGAKFICFLPLQPEPHLVAAE